MEGPELLDFKTTNLEKVQQILTSQWKTVPEDILEELVCEPEMNDDTDDNNDHNENEKKDSEENDKLPETMETNHSEDVQEKRMELNMMEATEENFVNENMASTSKREERLPDTDLSYQLKTKVGKSLYHVFGMTNEVKSFDSHHLKFRDYKYESDRAKCNNLITKFTSELKNIYRDSAKQVKEWEDAYLKKHLTDPLFKYMDSDMKKIYMKMINSKSLMKHFNIS
eukprot:TCONS_00037091-protein